MDCVWSRYDLNPTLLQKVTALPTTSLILCLERSRMLSQLSRGDEKAVWCYTAIIQFFRGRGRGITASSRPAWTTLLTSTLSYRERTCRGPGGGGVCARVRLSSFLLFSAWGNVSLPSSKESQGAAGKGHCKANVTLLCICLHREQQAGDLDKLRINCHTDEIHQD